MNEALHARLDRLALRLAELDAHLAEPSLAADAARWREVARERAEVHALVERHRRWRAHSADLDAANALLGDAEADPAMTAMARDEVEAATAALTRLEDELRILLLPRDPDDARPAFVEIRAGAGGDESALFAAALARMYLRHAQAHGWQAGLVSESASDLGGYRNVVLRIEGDDAYGRLKFESGGHRVQRVPLTESQGRIHTSACTVAVLPEPAPAQMPVIDPSQLRIDTFRASGAGGQHVNKTDSAVRITHLPTGIVAECQDDRSQHRNKARSMAVLAARIADRARQAQAAQDAATRRSLVGSGDRSDRIRTYNFPQGRVTDHRINLTLHRIQSILDGDLDELTDALKTAQARDQLERLEAGGAGR